jgi:hypothetical protein
MSGGNMSTDAKASPGESSLLDEIKALSTDDLAGLKQALGIATTVNKKRPGFLQEADGSWSSKRLQSFFTLAVAVTIAAFQAWHNYTDPNNTIELSVLIGSFLGYGAACQGMTLVK